FVRMDKYVIKRSGACEPFAAYKIKEAIEKGFHSMGTTPDDAVFVAETYRLYRSEISRSKNVVDFVGLYRFVRKKSPDVVSTRGCMLTRHSFIVYRYLLRYIDFLATISRKNGSSRSLMKRMA